MAKKIFAILLFFSLFSVPLMRVHAIPPGIGVIGDSASEPYRCIGRGNETSFTWTEELAQIRGLDFGPGVCQDYNHARSGEKIAVHMASQTAEVLSDFEAGKIGRVVIFLGYNDLYTATGTADVPSLLAEYRRNVERLLEAGMSPENILMIDIPQENWQGPVKALVDQFNVGLRDLANEKGTAFSSFATFYAERACRSTNGGSSYNIGGQIIRDTWGDEWHNFRLADGHLGTLANGILANTQVTGFLGIARMSDAEMLSVVNGQVIPSNPPPDCSPTATPSPTSTSTFTVTPVSSPIDTPGDTPEASSTPTDMLFPTDTPTITLLPSDTPSNTPTPTLVPSDTPTLAPTATATISTITLGEKNILSIPYSGLGNRLVAQQVTLSQSATIQSLSYYVATASGQLRLGIYNSAGNAPGALVAQTAAFTPTAGWNTRNVETPTLLPVGTYWLAFLPENNNLAGRLAQSGIGRHYTYSFGSMPATFSSSATGATFHFSLYATLLIGAVPSATSTYVPLPSITSTNTFEPTSTPTSTSVATLGPSHTLTHTPTDTLEPGSTPTHTSSPSFTPTPSPTTTSTKTSTPTAISTSTPTKTVLPSSTPTRTPTNTLVPNNTPTRTPTVTASGSSITIGETKILGTRYSGMGNRLAVQQVTLSQSATIQSLSYYVATASGQLRLGIYNNAGNSPGTLLAQTAAFTPVSGWNTQPVLVQTQLPAGTYWLAFLPQNNNLAGRLAQSGTGRHYTYSFGALPATFSSSSTSAKFHFSLYATLLTSAP